jgi:hypothetical protein
MRTRALVIWGAAFAAVSTVGCWGSDSYPPLERQRIGYSNHGSFFPIDVGAVHNRPDCEACHGGTATFLEFTCITCHDHAQAHTDSLHWGVDNYVYGATSCFGCHPNGTATGVDHAPFFPIGPGSVHSGQHCLDCHTDPANRRIFTCISCHTHSAELMNPAHSAVAGYEFDSAACLSCHPRAEVMTRALHQTFFPIATGVHSSAGCSDCHATPGLYTAFTCTSCHNHSAELMDPAHTTVVGYQFASPSCLGCHPDGSVMTPAQHQALFPIATGRHALPCSDCHTTPGDFSKFECYPCHSCATTTSRHSEVRNFTCVSSECYRCHPAGRGGDD